MDNINKTINSGYCEKICKDLEDLTLINTYKQSKSVIKKQENIKFLLKDILEDEKIDKVINKILPELIPPGTKGVIKGLKFNHFIKEKILNLKLEQKNYEIFFEKNHPFIKTDEIPDWYILNKKNKKTLIGMNQLDLWNGGHQVNRANKYIINNLNNNENYKIICVVCNKIIIKNKKNKIYDIFKEGFGKNILFYPNHLDEFIIKFFN